MNKIETLPVGSIPPIEYLRECFHHCAETGKLLWKERPAHHFTSEGAQTMFRKKGLIGRPFGARWNQPTTKRAGGLKGRLWYGNRYYCLSCHRIAWMIAYGEIPAGMEIDHKDGDATNNRLDNLRLASHSENIANASNYRGKKDGLPRGVYRNGKRFSASIRKDKKLFYIGTYDTPELAHEAYNKRAEELHGEFRRL